MSNLAYFNFLRMTVEPIILIGDAVAEYEDQFDDCLPSGWGSPADETLSERGRFLTNFETGPSDAGTVQAIVDGLLASAPSKRILKEVASWRTLEDWMSKTDRWGNPCNNQDDWAFKYFYKIRDLVIGEIADHGFVGAFVTDTSDDPLRIDGLNYVEYLADNERPELPVHPFGGSRIDPDYYDLYRCNWPLQCDCGCGGCDE